MTSEEDLASRADAMAAEIRMKIRAGTLSEDALGMAELLHTFAKQLRRGQLKSTAQIAHEIATAALDTFTNAIADQPLRRGVSR